MYIKRSEGFALFTFIMRQERACPFYMYIRSRAGLLVLHVY